ncbi:helix-turn-helix domain-containing protein [Asticcacaulis solisilvae]|uniref:helix-turn-helix domain-containing protein n=1 Tax=Asticcacaulis solisilvae TaxID=1217274 RepID=UPI003FD8ADFF
MEAVTAHADDKRPHPFDLHVGGRVRLRRRQLGMSQDTLAKAVEITFQQVQKYERGATRISASRLYDMARVLEVNVGYLCQGFGGEAEGGFMATAEGAELAAVFTRVRSPRQRQRIVDLVRILADS